ncbi:MAG: LysR family transcriptional regulator [Pseudomonadota bacterium]
MNELASMRAFVKVVEVGSFAEAARQTGTSKSVITKRVNQLESDLQLELLQRSTRRLDVTDTGTIFYERCVRILAELDDAKSAVSSMEWGLSGVFRVSCISSFTSAYLANDLCEFQENHPNLDIELHQHDRLCDPVQEGFDVCIQPESPQSGIIESAKLLPIRRLVVATEEYLNKFGSPKEPNDLSQHRFAHNNHVTPDPVIPYISTDKVRPVSIEPKVLTNTIWMLEAAVLNGECMALMPVFFIEEQLANGLLIPIFPEHRIQGAVLAAHYRKSQYVPMKIRIFVNFLRQKYGEVPPWERRLLKRLPELSSILGPRGTNTK